jgi:hypothetical protein
MGMNPDLRYTITKEEYDGFESLLVSEGFEVKFLSETITKKLDSGEIIINDRRGTLKFRDQEFRFEITKHSLGCSFDIRNFFEQIKVDDESEDRFFNALNRALPSVAYSDQNIRELPLQKFDWGLVLGIFSCLTMLAFAGAFIFFAIYGARAYFK